MRTCKFADSSHKLCSTALVTSARLAALPQLADAATHPVTQLCGAEPQLSATMWTTQVSKHHALLWQLLVAPVHSLHQAGCQTRISDVSKRRMGTWWSLQPPALSALKQATAATHKACCTSACFCLHTHHVILFYHRNHCLSDGPVPQLLAHIALDNEPRQLRKHNVCQPSPMPLNLQLCACPHALQAYQHHLLRCLCRCCVCTACTAEPPACRGRYGTAVYLYRLYCGLYM